MADPAPDNPLGVLPKRERKAPGFYAAAPPRRHAVKIKSTPAAPESKPHRPVPKRKAAAAAKPSKGARKTSKKVGTTSPPPLHVNAAAGPAPVPVTVAAAPAPVPAPPVRSDAEKKAQDLNAKVYGMVASVVAFLICCACNKLFTRPHLLLDCGHSICESCIPVPLLDDDEDYYARMGPPSIESIWDLFDGSIIRVYGLSAAQCALVNELHRKSQDMYRDGTMAEQEKSVSGFKSAMDDILKMSNGRSRLYQIHTNTADLTPMRAELGIPETCPECLVEIKTEPVWDRALSAAVTAFARAEDGAVAAHFATQDRAPRPPSPALSDKDDDWSKFNFKEARARVRRSTKRKRAEPSPDVEQTEEERRLAIREGKKPRFEEVV